MSNSIVQESVLHYFHGAFNKSAVPGSLFSDQTDCGLVIKEAPFSAHLNLRGDAADSEFCLAVAKVLNLTLPLVAGTYSRNGNTSIYWLGPSEWLIVEIGGDAAVIKKIGNRMAEGFTASKILWMKEMTPCFLVILNLIMKRCTKALFVFQKEKHLQLLKIMKILREEKHLCQI